VCAEVTPEGLGTPNPEPTPCEPEVAPKDLGTALELPLKILVL
jgi:hypothetical protein